MEGAERKGHTGHLKERPSGRLSDHLSPQTLVQTADESVASMRDKRRDGKSAGLDEEGI